MNESLFLQYENISLVEVTTLLQQNYYKMLDVFCDHITTYCNQLKTKRLTDSCYSYITLCNKLVADVRKYIEDRNKIYVPYLRELAEKDTTGHNCGNCSGRCELSHNIRLVDLKVSLQEMKQLLYHIRTAALHEDKIDDAVLKSLHTKMRLLDNMIDEMVQIEEEHLLPGIMKAQKNIHVAD